jgi:hypothetical protein
MGRLTLSKRDLPVIGGLPVLVLVAILVGASRRLFVGWDTPLWLDETYTGTLALQPEFLGLVQDCLTDIGGPVYYVLIWVWAKLFGVSNVALRLPSLICALAVPLVILMVGHPDRRTRYLWAALATLWLPGLFYAGEARTYSLLFLLGCWHVICFQQLLRTPTLRYALVWCSVSALLILTHYHALILVGLQGLIYLILHRSAVPRTWPAALVFAPAVGWMSVHLPVLFSFLNPEVTWHRLLTIWDMLAMPGTLFGTFLPGLYLVLLILGTTAADIYKAVCGKLRFPYDPIDLATGAASLAAVLLVVTFGFIRPSFTLRYLIAYMPGVLFGIAVWARTWEERWRLLPHLLVLCLIALTVQDFWVSISDPKRDHRWRYSWQEASSYFQSRKVRRIVYLWDNPSATLYEPSQLARAGGFFFHRAGEEMPVHALILAGRLDNPDPNTELLTAAANPDDAILWAYDINVKGSLGNRHPPRISQTDPQWDCRNFGGGPITVLGCVRGH